MADNKAPAIQSHPVTQAGETAPDVVVLPNKKVRARFKWRPYEGGTQYTTETVFDYSRCTEEQILLLAQDSATIKLQAMLRRAAAGSPTQTVDTKAFAQVDVLADIVSARSVKADPVAAAILALRKAGADEATIKATAAALAKIKKA